MALKQGLPSIRAEWLWEWIDKGLVRASPLFGTKVLIVAKSCRVSKTCTIKSRGKPVRRAVRYWLGKGIILVPRWDPIRIHYDPGFDEGIEVLDAESFRKKGLFRLINGEIVILIYQHVEDALHFQRQQWHIQLDTYAKEMQKASSALEALERSALEKISAGESSKPEEGSEFSAIVASHQARRNDISHILVNLASREKAAEVLIRNLQRELRATESGIQGIFSSKSMKDLPISNTAPIDGLRAYVARIYSGLNQIKVRPVIRCVSRVQLHLRSAMGALDVRENEIMVRQLALAVKYLKQAEDQLQQPAQPKI